MTYVIAEPCIGTKDNSCVEVCPVDCIHPTPDEAGYDAVEMLFIDPDECIDCDACVEACPVDAIFAEDQLPAEWSRFKELNADYFKSAAARTRPGLDSAKAAVGGPSGRLLSQLTLQEAGHERAYANRRLALGTDIGQGFGYQLVSEPFAAVGLLNGGL